MSSTSCAGLQETLWLAGGKHYRNFRSYIQKSGLPELLLGIPFTEIERHYFAQHGVVLLLLRKERLKGGSNETS